MASTTRRKKKAAAPSRRAPTAAASDPGELGAALLEAPAANVNNVAKLLALARSGEGDASLADEGKAKKQASDELAAREAIRWLKLFFVEVFDKESLGAAGPARLVAAGGEGGDNEGDEALRTYHAWLRQQYATFKATLLSVLERAAPASVQIGTFVALMECVRLEAVGQFNDELFAEAVTQVLTSAHAHADTMALLIDKYSKFDDVRYFLYKCTRQIAEKVLGKVKGNAAAGDDGDDVGIAPNRLPADDIAANCLDVLLALKPDFHDAAAGNLTSWCGAAEVGVVSAAPIANESVAKRKKRQREEKESGSRKTQRAAWAGAKNSQTAFSEAWLALLRLQLPEDLLKKALIKLPGLVIPRMVNPWLLSDFLTSALDSGGFLGMLALNGIFILVTQHGLEYPKFYAKLYALLQPEVIHAKHRMRFLQLADVFLASRLVPAYTVAAFIKRFARIAVRAPPAGAMACMAFMHNLILRHPSCAVLLHNPRGDGGEDPFDEFQQDPAEARGAESSLWELTVLRQHYSPQVVGMTRMFDRDLTDRRKVSEVDLESVVGGSYATLLEAELTRPVKRVAVAFYAKPPERLFGEHSKVDLVGWSMS